MQSGPSFPVTSPSTSHHHLAHSALVSLCFLAIPWIPQILNMFPLLSFALTLSEFGILLSRISAWHASSPSSWSCLNTAWQQGLTWQSHLKFHFLTLWIHPIPSPTSLFSTGLRVIWHNKYFAYFSSWLWSPLPRLKVPCKGTLICFVHYHIPST